MDPHKEMIGPARATDNTLIRMAATMIKTSTVLKILFASSCFRSPLLLATKAETENCLSYWKTKFFRALIGVKKNTQHCTKDVYQYVPLQDFSKPWTDKELYEKYDLDQKEIDFIENNVESMED